VSVIINVAVGSNCEKLSVSKYLPGYSSKRISLDAVDMSQRCQFRTHAAPKNAPLFDDIVGPSNKRRRNIGAERLGRNKPARFTPQAMRPPASTCSLSPYLRFWRWAQKGVWERVFKALCDDPDFEDVLIDGTLVRVH
jgi:hypothetical protein